MTQLLNLALQMRPQSKSNFTDEKGHLTSGANISNYGTMEGADGGFPRYFTYVEKFPVLC